MSRFCGKCGAPLPEGAGFCRACGAGVQQVPAPAAHSGFQPVSSPPTASPAQSGFQSLPSSAPPPPFVSAAPVAKSTSPWLKIVIVLVVVILAVGAMAVGGVIYVRHKVSQKAEEYKRELLGETAAATPTTGGDGASSPSALPADATASAAPSGFAGDACRLLSKQDVSRAVGVDVVGTATTDGGCSYFAKGTSVDMTAKHATAMVSATATIDKKSQGMLEQFAGAVGNSMPKNGNNDNDRPDGTTVVLAFGIDTNSAEEQMRLNSKVLGIGAIGGIDAIDGIGDEAFSKSDSMMFVRKGDKLIRITYMTCPCGTEAIKPLAKEIVANL